MEDSRVRALKPWRLILLPVAMVAAFRPGIVGDNATRAAEHISADISASYGWRQVPLAGMGFVTGAAAGLDGTVYVRTDVSGIFRWERDKNTWTALQSGLPEGQNCESLAVAPNGDVLTASGGSNPGHLYRLSKRNGAWSKAELPVAMNGNGPRRRAGERLAIDPNGGPDGQIVYFGSRSDGLWRSADGGKNWRAAAGVPAGAPGYGIVFVAFDPSSGDAERPSSTLYVGVTDGGIYRSDDGGVGWDRVDPGASGPQGLDPIRGQVDAQGRLWVTFIQDNASQQRVDGGGLWRLSGDSWTNLTPPGLRAGLNGLSVDPSNPERALVSAFDLSPDAVKRTEDGGATWFDVPLSDVTVPGWWPDWHLFSWVGNVLLNSAEGQEAWVTSGFGVYRTDDVETLQPQWRADMRGLEEICVYHLRSPPRGAPLLAGTADMFGFRIVDPLQTPSSKILPDGFGFGTSVDYFEGDPNIVAIVGSDQKGATPHGLISRDNGQSWQQMANPNPGKSFKGVWDGNIAISADSADNLVWVPNNSAGVEGGNGAIGAYFSKDGGKSWGLSSGLPRHIHPLEQHWFGAEVLAADRVAPGTFYVLQSNHGQRGLYRSTNGGESFELMNGTSTYAWSYTAGIRAIPGSQGQVWIFYGRQDGPLQRTLDGGRTIVDVAGVQKAIRLGLGKPAPGRRNPALYLLGTIDGVSGVFRSDDATATSGNAEDATWVLLSDLTVPVFNGFALEGDGQSYGRVYMGSACGGLWVAQPGGFQDAVQTGGAGGAGGAEANGQGAGGVGDAPGLLAGGGGSEKNSGGHAAANEDAASGGCSSSCVVSGHASVANEGLWIGLLCSSLLVLFRLRTQRYRR